MSTSSLLSMGAQALLASQVQLSTAGHNIVNASVEGYSRQSAKLRTVQGVNTGVGYIGGGVNVSSVDRAVNQFMTQRVAQTSSYAAAESTRADMMAQLEKSFGLGTNGLGQAVSSMFSAFGDLAASPGDNSVRTVVLSQVASVSTLFNHTAEQVQNLHDATVSQVQDEVSQINDLAGQIANVNKQITALGNTNTPPNDLYDQRDQLVKQLSEHVLVSRVDNTNSAGETDGTVNLFIAGGQALVVGDSSHALSSTIESTTYNPISLSIDDGQGHARKLGTDALGGGTLGGLMQFQDKDLISIHTQLDNLASSLATAVNTQQQAGLDASGNPGQALLVVGSDGALGMHTNLSDPRLVAAADSSGLNGNALKMQALAKQAITSGMTFTDAHARMISDIGVRAQQATSRSDAASQVATSAQEQLSSQTGVNVDEEAAKMMEYQQSYQAAAKVMSAAQKMFDTLLSLGN